MFGFLKKRQSPLWNEDLKGFEKQFSHNVFQQNRILAQNLYTNIDSQHIRHNGHTFVLADSADAHNLQYANLLQANANYVIPDVGGEIYKHFNRYLEQQGYTVHVINLRDHASGACYNPIMSMRCSGGSYAASAALFAKSIWFGAENSDPFSQRGAETLLATLLNYIKTLPDEKQNMKTLNELLHLPNPKSETPTEAWSFLEQCDSSAAQAGYRELTRMPGRMFLQALADTSFRLYHLNFEKSERAALSFMPFAFGKHALFIQYPGGQSYETMIGLICAQIMDVIYGVVEYKPSHRCDRPLCIMTNGWIPELANEMITANRYNIHFFIHYTHLAHLKHRYPHDWEMVMNGCDAIVYMNRDELDYISTMLRHTVAFVKPGHPPQPDLQAVKDALLDMPANKCIVFFRGVRALCATKYKWAEHPQAGEIPLR